MSHFSCGVEGIYTNASRCWAAKASVLAWCLRQCPVDSFFLFGGCCCCCGCCVSPCVLSATATTSRIRRLPTRHAQLSTRTSRHGQSRGLQTEPPGSSKRLLKINVQNVRPSWAYTIEQRVQHSPMKLSAMRSSSSRFKKGNKSQSTEAQYNTCVHLLEASGLMPCVSVLRKLLCDCSL